MDEESLKNSIELYKSQLNQVEQAIEAAGETDDMVKLKDDLKELIALTEDSLLSLLKGQLLQSIESTSTTTIDDEYAAFQEALGEDTTKNDSTDHDTDNTIPGEDNSIDESLEESLLELQGMRCRAPFQHDWGCLAYYNALIHSVDPVSHNTQCPMVNVMFCNPTHSSMALCPFYLEGRCKFSDDECRNSHGYPVKIEDLQEYQEPNYSLVKIDTKCLAQYEDGLWYKATVIDMKDQKIQVLFDEYGDKTSIGLERILPIDNGDDISDEESELDDDLNKPLDRSDSEDDDALPVFLWKPPKTTAKLGEWEEHTKGIGSKLMIKMGYIIGQGLGKNGDGKAEPVPIQLIPKGKSLDKIMELKEIAGDQDLFDAMKKLKKKTKKTEDKNRQPKQTSQPTDMFDFINKKLRGKKGNLHDLVIKHPVPGTSHGNHSKKNITEKDLQSKSDRHLNIQLLKTDEELKSVDKELKSLKQSLARNQLRDKAAAKRIEAKIASLVEYQHNLRTSERTMSQHKQRRKDHKKLTIF